MTSLTAEYILGVPMIANEDDVFITSREVRNEATLINNPLIRAIIASDRR
jgi:hypothetical protein